jgi:hypothetical protein
MCSDQVDKSDMKYSEHGFGRYPTRNWNRETKLRMLHDQAVGMKEEQ